MLWSDTVLSGAGPQWEKSHLCSDARAIRLVGGRCQHGYENERRTVHGIVTLLIAGISAHLHRAWEGSPIRRA